MDLLCHYLGFILANGAVQSNALAVNIGQRNGVVVDQHQASCPGARQRFNRVGSHAAYAEYNDGRMFKG